MLYSRQTTLRDSAVFCGAGVHSNAPVRMVLHPSDADTGIVFLRRCENGTEKFIPALWSNVSKTELCTVVGQGPDGSVSTVEHLLSALAGLGVDNVLIEIDGPEVPIMDGSAAAFVEGIDRVGVVELAAPRSYIRVLKPVRVEHGLMFSELRPAAQGFRLEVEIDFTQAVIGRQKAVVDLDAGTFRSDIARARTFGFLRDVERLWNAGLALGSSLENSVAIGNDDRILNPEGLRFADEFVRHKTLDAVGDLALAGRPIIGAYRSYRGGHKMNVAVLEALFADSTAYEIVDAPRPRRAGAVETVLAAAPAFAADHS
ncbi:MAG TPA: UDP-3-O-acyl-N-acetylglucosamine deacetylase [Beijerinckiaceae bacterium]|jgi:UDP-3-O-[3-hydroxymyristoyl] N-acetylglucosamine deacetylase|nr:UDP-3-O-acyl-N-acetylglucosamine deacetylase [Beijerinckiaceae bacterium]